METLKNFLELELINVGEFNIRVYTSCDYINNFSDYQINIMAN